MSTHYIYTIKPEEIEKENNQHYSTTMSKNSVRIVVVGKTGVGKSASGNTILGVKMFSSEAGPTSITKECTSGKQMINDREVLVVDTPGLYDTSMSNEEVVQEIKKRITLAAPGPHVFLLVLSLARFTEEERSIIRLIQEHFANGVVRYMMILLTRADDLEDRTIKDYIDETPELKQLIKACEGGYHAFNNKEKSDRTQVNQLMRKIEVMMSHNQDCYYNKYILQMADELNNTRRIVKEKDEIIAGLQNKIKLLENCNIS